MAAEFMERENPDFTVDTAESVTEALDMLSSGCYDCVVSDYDMPEMDGLDLLESIRDLQSDIPFILYTGKGSEEVASEAITAGVTDYLQKESGTSQYQVLTNRVENAVEQHHAQGKMEETQQRLTEIAENTDDVLFVYSGDWSELLFVNSAYEEIWGGSVEDLQEDPTAFMELIHPDDREDVQRKMKRVADGEHVRNEYRVTPPEGDVRHVRADTRPIEEDGEVERIVGYIRDITPEKTREQVLEKVHDITSDRSLSFDAQVEELLEVVRDSLDVDYGTVSRIEDGDYVFEHVASDDDTVEAGDVVPVDATNCEIVVESKEALAVEDVARDLPGETGRAGYTDWGINCYLGAPVYVDDEVHGTLCFYGREPRRESFTEWETTLVEIAANWVSYELQRQKANEELQLKNQRLEEFAAVLSHDIRNPLGVIDGYVELARETGDVSHLDSVSRAVERMDEIVDDVLALESTDYEPDTADVSIETAVRDAWSNVSTGDAELEVEVDLVVEADGSQLQQMLENLLRNAVEHGGSEIKVGELETGFYVEDDGEGLSEDVDDVFARGETSGEGTGLGLYIVQRVADAHGWTVELVDAADGGVRVEVTGVEPVERDS